MTRSSSFLDLLGIDAPIIQAPMAGISTPEMAAAASNAGVLGSLGVGATDADGARRLIVAFRCLSTRSLNVNVFCHAPAVADRDREARWIEKLTPELIRHGAAPPRALREIYKSFVEDDPMLSMLIAEGPKVVSFHFGAPGEERVRALRDAGIVLLGTATSLVEARALERAGVHAVVAQGYEAGGHRGVFDPDAVDDRLGVFSLTRLLVRELCIPVVAAGAIMDGAGIAAALALGASAAQLGTAFVLCNESGADAGYRAALQSESSHHTTVTRAISGRPARCLSNRFTALGDSVSPADIPAYPIAYDLGKALHGAAKAHGDFGYGAQWAGQGAPLARTFSTMDLIAALRRELKETI